MTVIQLMADLARKGVVLTANGDRLAYDAPREVLTPAMLAELKLHKGELLRLLQRPKAAPPVAEPTMSPTAPLLTPAQVEAWFQVGALAPSREQFEYDYETKTYPGWWDYLYEIHNRGLAVVNGKVVNAI